MSRSPDDLVRALADRPSVRTGLALAAYGQRFIARPSSPVPVPSTQEIPQ